MSDEASAQPTVMGNESLSFWADINDEEGKPTLTFAIEHETGKPITVVIKDRETLQPLHRYQIPIMSTATIGQALTLAGTMKAAAGG